MRNALLEQDEIKQNEKTKKKKKERKKERRKKGLTVSHTYTHAHTGLLRLGRIVVSTMFQCLALGRIMTIAATEVNLLVHKKVKNAPCPRVLRVCIM